MGNARAEEVYSNGRQKAILLMLAIDETHAHFIFESLQLECLYIEDLLLFGSNLFMLNFVHTLILILVR